MVDKQGTDGAPPRAIHIERKKVNWLAWILLLLGVAALLFALLRHRDDAADVAVAPVATGVATPPVAVEAITLPNGRRVDLAPATLNYDLQRYLASDAAAPRTFTFDKLNFDTASAAIRAEDRPTLDALGQILTAYPTAKVALIGYADARGSDATNATLGAARGNAVMKALTDGGIAADRISIGTGGEARPVADNGTADGQFENRRTELVVTSK
ncbi:OmpA family protein [Sphingomonas montana]|uniref:OmpA family protein n=1 Tax=Sphingomonas montana TaxID=1843236 RepID=UPI00096E1545|nr:OmpA family protein [Sphingomonas montana]